MLLPLFQRVRLVILFVFFPVWVIKTGQFDMVQLTSRDSAMIEAAEISFEQALMRVLKT